ncbi:hypothetical protein ACFLXE_00315 [Chloroflexota bacterium]
MGNGEHTYEQYEHHKELVWVRSDLKGKHRDHCMCFDCRLFLPDDREHNCPIANVLYAVCVAFGLCTPVWECPNFEPTNY